MTGSGTVSLRFSPLPRTNFNSSRLIRLLTEIDDVEANNVVRAKQGFADRLSRWLDWTDAISLSAALDAGVAVRQPGVPSASQSAADAAAEEFTRVRAALAQAITMDDLFVADKPGTKLPPLIAGAAPESAADFLPFRRRHAAHQRDMAAAIGPLRARVRAALKGMSPALGRLATLDAAMADALAARERQLLATVPSLLERHFKRLCQLHPLQALQPLHQHPQTPADPSPRAAAWLAEFRRCMRAILLAELDLRLMPVEGMIEAIRDEISSRQ